MKIQTVSEINFLFRQSDESKWQELIELHKPDLRPGVKNIVERYSKKLDAYNKEQERLKTMYQYEEVLYAEGAEYVCGIDEVGRGPLAGPVVACAVILPKGFVYPGINDSKKLTEKKRTELDRVIRENAISFAISEVSAGKIDEINILNGTKKAMSDAVRSLKVQPSHLLIDAVKLSDLDIPQTSVIGGDARSVSIASASILAKVYRDSLMKELSAKYPEYGFDSNKGYGSKAHIEAIKKYGLSPCHRVSFKLRD